MNTLFVEQISHQINFFAGNIWRHFFFVEETFDHVPGNEKDQVSPICRYRTIPETKLGANLGHFRHRRTIGIYKRTWKQAKIAERNLTTCKWIFHQLAAKNLNINAVQRSTASVIQYSIGKYIIHLFDRPESGYVHAKKYLAGHHDRRPAVRYFEPWSSCIACCIFHVISIPFNCSDTTLKVTEAMIGLKVKIFVFTLSPCLLCFSNLVPELIPRIFDLFSFRNPGWNFSLWTQGEIHPGNRASPVNRAHVKRS